MFNNAGEKIFGYLENEILGENPKKFSSGLHDKIFYEKMWKDLNENKSWFGEIWNKKANGEIFPQQMSIRVVCDENGNTINYVAVMMDISEHKEAKRKLEEINTRLKDIVDEEVTKNREKDAILIKQSRQAAMGEMISNIAHQWRQPLNALGIAIQDAKMAWKFNEVNEQYIDEMIDFSMKQINYMSQTINDFRTFFKPESDKSSFNLNNIVTKVENLIFASLNAHDIQFITDVPEDIFIYGYENQLVQVILNIISNAKDATIENSTLLPKIEIYAKKQDNKCSLIIQDNGGGIGDSIIDKIFDPYFTTKEQGKGTGIGLYMAKTIIENNMTGSIKVSNANSGARFEVLLPVNDSK
jgi:PAS domain S-box-containing protein